MDVNKTKKKEIRSSTQQTTIITTRTLNLNILNDITATASFIFDYSLLFQLYKQLDATVENATFHLNPFARFNSG